MKMMHRLMAAAVFSSVAAIATAQELQNYVSRCQTELRFQANEVQPMNCNEGKQFFTNGGRGPINDYVVHKRVNNEVDMVAACRWGDGTSTKDDNKRFISIELILHNRVNGGTCFFAAADIGDDPPNPPPNEFKPVSTKIVSPTNFDPRVYPNASHFWLTPTQLNSKLMLSNAKDIPEFKEQLQCVRCHSQGPYIASPDIAPYLANLGLLNDGHDTFVDFSKQNHYFVVGSNAPSDPGSGSHPFKDWHSLIVKHNEPPEMISCSDGCHARARDDKPTDGSFLPIGDLSSLLVTSPRVLPSIAYDIYHLERCCMPPSPETSHFRWINIDQPGADGAEVETFTSSKNKIPVMGYCKMPGWIEASAAGANAVFSSMDQGFMPNKLRAFNLRDGLTCLNSDQPGGARCADHQVSYKCPGPREEWTPYYNKDKSTTDDGDHEERSRSIGDATAFCGGKTPIAFRMQLVDGSYGVNGPNDRLAQLTRSGLVCRNSEQGSGQSCSSYVVRYRGCRTDATLSKIKNAWTSLPTFGDRYLTTTNNVDGAETRAQGNNYQYPSQDWMIEPIPGGNTVRLADVWSGKYLTASSNSDQAVVQVKNRDLAQLRQQWVMETISGSSEVRFKNLGSGRYLTVGNYTGDPYYAPIISQTLSNQNWASQRWVVQ